MAKCEIKVDMLNLEIPKEMYNLIVDIGRSRKQGICNICYTSACVKAKRSMCYGYRARDLLTKIDEVEFYGDETVKTM